MKEIVIDGFRNIEKTMEELSAEHAHDWQRVNWQEPDSNLEIYEEGITVTMEELQDYIVEDSLEDYAISYLYAYFNYLDGTGMSSDHIGVRFEVMEQTENSFQASFLILADEAQYVSPGKNIVTFKKDGELWKLNGEQFIPAEEEPLQLTFSDLEEYYQLLKESFGLPGELELIDEVENNQGKFIIYQFDGHIEARDVSDSKLNVEMAEQYRAGTAAAEETAETEETTGEAGIDGGSSPTETVFQNGQYEIVTKEEKNEFVEVSVSYPILNKGAIDENLKSRMEEQFQDYHDFAKDIESAAKEHGQVYWFHVAPEDLYDTDHYVSMKFVHNTYEGGAHGNTFVETLTYDKASGALLSLEDVFAGDTSKLELVSSIVREELMNQEGLFEEVISEETEAKWDNFPSFILTEHSTLKIYFQPYEVGPYAAGVIEVEIGFEELGLNN